MKVTRAIGAGELDRRVTLKIMSTTRGSSGSAKPVVSRTISNVPAGYYPLRGMEAVRAGANAAEFDARFFMRFREDLRRKDQVVLDGQTFDVYSIAEVGRRQYIEVMAKARFVT